LFSILKEDKMLAGCRPLAMATQEKLLAPLADFISLNN
jgi:hypothetical protein